jgi:CubicO group peptidase (beta-lactamase class C family)
VVVIRDGHLACREAFGFRDRSAQDPMRLDSIFRIASMTKPVTVTAALMLLEQGRIALGDPVSRFLPELSQPTVGIERVDAASGERRLDFEAARRAMTVQDLMRHTAGFTYGPLGDSLVQRAYRQANLMDDQQTNAGLVIKLAELPLAFQPGTTFEYGMSTDVLGRVVEVVSGLPLDRFFAERIFGPLGMDSTGFGVATAQTHRLAEPQRDPTSGPRLAVPPYNPARPAKWFSGGGGLLSTARDYAQFSQLLLNGGELRGVRLLSRKSVALMTNNHLPAALGYGPLTHALGAAAPLPELGQAYGLGLGVRLQPGLSIVPGSVGDFYWGGATGPYFWVDPAERLIVVFMLQEFNAQRRARYRSLLRNLVYQALD